MERDSDTRAIIAAALEVHRQLGPGLLESAYRECLARELVIRGLPFQREMPLEILYRGAVLPLHYRLDLVVAGSIVVEVKSLERILPVHPAQLLTYLRISGYSRGLLINFNVARLAHGIRRVVNGWLPGSETPTQRR
jgi:GxxExxY protein